VLVLVRGRRCRLSLVESDLGPVPAACASDEDVPVRAPLRFRGGDRRFPFLLGDDDDADDSAFVIVVVVDAIHESRIRIWRRLVRVQVRVREQALVFREFVHEMAVDTFMPWMIPLLFIIHCCCVKHFVFKVR